MKNVLLFSFLLSLGQGALAEEAYQVTAKAWSALGRKDWNVGRSSQANEF
jgi:hypothetical protein